jgi:hypothetical protein
MLMQPQTGGAIFAGFAAVVGALLWWMRRLSMRGRLLVLFILAVSVPLVLMTALQVPEFPHWLLAGFVVVIFLASPIAVRNFMASLGQEEEESMRDSSR